MRAEALLPLAPLPALDCACASLRRAARAVTQLYEAALQDTGLRATQFTLLQALERQGRSPQTAVGETAYLYPPTLGSTLLPPARAGWIRAGAGAEPPDGRRTLTPQGGRRRARAPPASERAH